MERTGPPDFVGVGVQRSGTTWWFAMLAEHDRIRAPRTKELHFFDRFCGREMTAADIAAYHELFPRGEGEIAGEWTPRYMSDVWTPILLARAAPEAKLLVLLRDPIERYRSGIVHRLRVAPERTRELIATDAVERGRYASQLARLRSHFAADRILVLQYERCSRDPVGEYRRTLRFLGLDDDHVPDGIDRPQGTTSADGKEPLWPEMETALRLALAPEIERLAELAPDLDMTLWPSFAASR